MNILILTKDSSERIELNYGLGTVIKNFYETDSSDHNYQIITVPDNLTQQHFSIIENGQFDILHTHDIIFPADEGFIQNFLNLKSKKNFKWIHSFHVDFHNITFTGYINKFEAQVDPNLFQIRYADLLMFHSEKLKYNFLVKYRALNYVPNYKIKNSIVINLGYDPKKFYHKDIDRDEFMKKYIGDLWEDHKHKKILLYSGRSTYQKGIMKFNTLGESKWISENIFPIWIGDMSIAINQYYSFMGCIGLKTPKIPQDKLNDFYNVADIFWNPSEQEPFGLTTLEAMATLNPIILGNSKIGILFDNKLDKILLRNLTELEQNLKLITKQSNSEKKEMYEKYEKILPKYDWEMNKFLLEKVYDHILSDNMDSLKNISEEETNNWIFKDNNNLSSDMNSQYKKFINELEIRESDTVLDIAGNKDSSNIFLKYVSPKNYKITNLDKSIDLKNIFNQEISTNNLLKYNLYNPKQFDIINASEVLEHTSYSYQFFQRLLILSKKYVIVSYPINFGTYTHYNNRIDFNALNRLALQQGFECIKKYSYQMDYNQGAESYITIWKRMGNK